MPSFLDLTGHRFGRWLVVKRGEDHVFPSGKKQPSWHCKCDCGNEKKVKSQALRDGSSKSCGCLNVEVRREVCIKRNTKHGYAANGKDRTYRIWCGMNTRCHNPRSSGYYKYGARGITVSEAWRKSFEKFLSDMGPCPPEYSIERRNPNLGYSKENCCWIPLKYQNRNKTNSRIFFLNLAERIEDSCP